MTLQEILADIHALNEDLETYERKYGVLSETFCEPTDYVEVSHHLYEGQTVDDIFERARKQWQG